MPTIYRRNSERISVADAKQLILNALPIELGGGQIFGKPGPDGEPIWDFDSLAQVSAAEAHAPYLDSDFLELCKGLGFEPHMMFSPAIGGYSGNPEQDNSYMLTHAQFVKLAEKYSLTVEIETASPAPAQSAAEPAPVVTESARDAPETEWHLMATPDELCAAFGTFTGMNKDWFSNLKDRPALKAARFQPGRGGRNKVEPLFYVYPVLQWLIDKRRKTGKPMQEATGWRMLRQHFPRVYETYEPSAPDPD